MSSIWGKNIKISLFGESHGPAIGVVIDGLFPGIKLDIEKIKKEMARRKPGKDEFSTPRAEDDDFEIISGFFNGYTTGTPLAVLIRNKNKRSKDYKATKDLVRPGHADFTGFVRYGGYNDYRGGGHFSGRLTAPIVFAGAVAEQVLSQKGIVIGSHIYSIKNVKDVPLDRVNPDSKMVSGFREKAFPLIDPAKEEEMKQVILSAKKENDSVGGIIETIVLNFTSGLGAPFFDSIESRISQMIFSIPAVKGIEFGAGFSITGKNGSSANDEFIVKDGYIRTKTNNNGGINGGISNGMPIVFRTAIKPTPSIAKKQRTVDISSMEETALEIKGRHDPCIVPRALPVIDAATALVMLDIIIEGGERWL